MRAIAQAVGHAAVVSFMQGFEYNSEAVRNLHEKVQTAQKSQKRRAIARRSRGWQSLATWTIAMHLPAASDCVFISCLGSAVGVGCVSLSSA